MKITIHRGIDQIGGCITEISTATSRILIDLGQNLPDSNGNAEDSLGNKNAIDKLTEGIDAILFTHYHSDHLGHFHFVADAIPLYIGETAQKIIYCKHKRLSFIPGREKLSKIELDKIENMRTFVAQQEIVIGDIMITPCLVSHSAYDCYMFLVEAEGKRVLHTGDFRGHGYLSKGLFSTIENKVLDKGKIDFLITEGTMISRADEIIKHEQELQEEAAELMKEYKNVFVLCSSTDLERLATFNAANKTIHNRPLICDAYQKKILDIFSATAGKTNSLFNFGEIVDFQETDEELIEKMKEEGFCFLIRCAKKFDAYYKFMKPLIDDKQTLLIYSAWEGSIDKESVHFKEDYFQFIEQFPNMEILHTSGHASIDTLAEVCNLINPISGIIPIHCEKSSEYKNINITEELKERIILELKDVDDVIVEILKPKEGKGNSILSRIINNKFTRYMKLAVKAIFRSK